MPTTSNIIKKAFKAGLKKSAIKVRDKTPVEFRNKDFIVDIAYNDRWNGDVPNQRGYTRSEFVPGAISYQIIPVVEFFDDITVRVVCEVAFTRAIQIVAVRILYKGQSTGFERVIDEQFVSGESFALNAELLWRTFVNPSPTLRALRQSQDRPSRRTDIFAKVRDEIFGPLISNSRGDISIRLVPTSRETVIGNQQGVVQWGGSLLEIDDYGPE